MNNLKASIFKDMVQLNINLLYLKHPEVYNIGLLMLLFAGTTSILNFKYSILNYIVKKLNQWSLSAGNIYNMININGTSETLSNKTVVKTENIKYVSVHVPKHLKPVNDEQFGYYLAGLIEGEGNFSSKQQLLIVFNKLDAFLAYYIRGRIGFGKIKKITNKNIFILVISTKKGIERVINLINGKIRTENKLNQRINNILSHQNYLEFNKKINFKLNFNKDFKNHWLAGFSDANARFNFNLINYKYENTDRIEIRLNFHLDQKDKQILFLIKDLFGGNISYIESSDTYNYGSTSFGSAKKIINYFDHFHLLSSKHINYLKWRKAYLIIQDKNHLTKNGLDKIIKLKNTMNRLKDTTTV
jgi:LAGLIDADG endonuclease